MVTYPFEVTVHNVELMHIHQTVHNVDELSRRCVSLLSYRDSEKTHQVDPIRILVALDESVDRPIFHPIRNHRTPPPAKRNSNQRKDIWMPKVSPYYRLFAEFLGRVLEKCRIRHDGDTNSEDCFRIAEVELHNLYGHRTSLITPFEHVREPSAVYRSRHRLAVTVLDFG